MRAALSDTQAWLSAHARTPLYRNAYALMLSSVLTSGLGLLYWVLAARLFTPGVVGLNAAAIAAMTLLSGVSLLSLTTGVVRYLPRAGAASISFVKAAYGVTVVAGIVAALIFVAGIGLWSPGLASLAPAAVLALLFVIGTSTWSVFRLQDDVLAAVRAPDWIPVENGLYSVLKIALLIPFAALFTRVGIFASWTVPAIAALIPINLLLFRRLLPVHARATEATAQPIVIRSMARFLSGDYAGSLLSLMSSTLLPLLVTREAGAIANAYFYLPWVLAQSMMTMAVNMSTSLTVEGSREEETMGRLAGQALLHIGRLFAPVVALILLAAPIILGIFGARYAAHGADLLRLLALATFPATVNTLYVGICQVRRSIGPLIAVQAALAVITLGLTWFLLPRVGLIGVGLAWALSQTLVAVSLLLFPMRTVLRTGVA